MRTIKKAIIGVGRPRCGKKTHLQYIADELEAPYIDMGEYLRDLKKRLAAEGRVPPELAPLAETGLVNDSLIMSLFKEWSVDKLKSPFLVLDGIPRNVEQARLVLPYLKNNGGYSAHTLWFTTSAKVCMNRPSRDGRDDDSSEKIAARMRDYDALTAPMYGVLKARTRLFEVDNSEREIHAVREVIARFLGIEHILSSAA